MLFTFHTFIHRAVWSTLIKFLLSLWQITLLLNLFITMLQCSLHSYKVCLVVKLAFNFICSWFVTLYLASIHFSVTNQFYSFIRVIRNGKTLVSYDYGFVHDLFLHCKYACWYQYLARSNRIICEHYSTVCSISSAH